jgi:hypothetical protein
MSLTAIALICSGMINSKTSSMECSGIGTVIDHQSVGTSREYMPGVGADDLLCGHIIICILAMMVC